MIKVRITKKNNVIESIHCNGHANYSRDGKDIVCASFSTMIITTINAILEFDKDAISYTGTNDLEIINWLTSNGGIGISLNPLSNYCNLLINPKYKLQDI